MSAFLGPLAGWEIDKHGGRNVLVASNLVFAVGLALLGVSQGPVLLFCAWLVLGAGMVLGLYEAPFSTLAAIYGIKVRSSIRGITLIAGFASTVCWPISAYLDAEFGWRATCYFWTALHILVGLPLNRFMLPGIIRHASEDAAKPPINNDDNKWDAALLALVFAITWFTSTAMAAHLRRILQEAGVSTASAVAAGALIGPSQVAARIAEFGLLRKVSPLFSARLASVTHSLGAAMLALIGPPAAAFSVILHGAANGVMTIAKGTLPLGIFGAHGYGLRQGVLMVPARFAQAAAPFAFGVLVDSWGVGALAGC